MSMKKADLAKQLAKKVDGRMKASSPPQRFGQASTKATKAAEQAARPTAAKLVPVSCRLPAELASRLRERAIGHEGGVSALVAQALEQWLRSADSKG